MTLNKQVLLKIFLWQHKCIYNKYATANKYISRSYDWFILWFSESAIIKCFLPILNYLTHRTSCLDKKFCDCNVSLLFYIFISVTGSDEAKRCRTDGCNWGYTRGCCCWEFAAMSKVWIYSYEQLYYELLNVRSVLPIISVSQYGWDFGLLMSGNWNLDFKPRYIVLV